MCQFTLQLDFVSNSCDVALPYSAQRQLPTELLKKILENVDVVTAISFSLANRRFRGIFLGLFKELFGHGLNLPLPLSTKVQVSYGGQNWGDSITLGACIGTWMPAHLTYDPWADMFVGPITLEERLEEIMGEAEEEVHERDTRHHQRRLKKEERQEERAEEKKLKRQLKLDRQEIQDNCSEQYSGSEFREGWSSEDSDSESGRGSHTDDELDSDMDTEINLRAWN